MSVGIRMEGPLFDGRAARAMDAYCDQAREDIAEFAETMALNEMGAHFKHPTGYYESRVITDRVSGDTSRVWDQDVVYGPWLEGVGSKNRPRPGFPGYKHWRRTKAITKQRAPQIAEHTLARFLPEMRG